MRTFVVLLLLAAVVLAFFNPGREAFEAFAAAQSERIIQEEAGDAALGRVLAGAGGALAEAYVGRITERDNYVLFSVYTIDFDGPDAEGGEWRFLGIAGRFIELERPEMLDPNPQ